MRWVGWVILISLTLHMQSIAQGRVVYEGLVFSKNFGTNRMVRVYLPPSYERQPECRFLSERDCVTMAP